MGSDIQLVSDGNGLAVIGSTTDIELFVASEGLSSKELDLSRLGRIMNVSAGAAQAGSQIAESSGRWVMLTKESAEKVARYGLMDTKTPGVKHAMIGKPGDIKSWIQIVKSPASIATNPALLSGAAGIMSQLASQQAMAEITDYLRVIDEKLDDLIRSQMNQVLARMDGVDLAVREAMTLKASVGHVSDITWSKIQSTSITIMETQAYALRQLADVADKLEKKSKVGDLAEVTQQAEAEIRKWLGILARCVQLHEAIAVLELDRVLDASPDELDRHRLGLDAARRDRLDMFEQTTRRLLARMHTAIETANAKVLTNPMDSPAVVRSGNEVVAGVLEFHEHLGLDSDHQLTDARRWSDAAGEKVGTARSVAAGGIGKAKGLGVGAVGQAKELGVGAVGQAKSAKDSIAGRLADRKDRRKD